MDFLVAGGERSRISQGENLREQVYRILKFDIMVGRFRPGEHITLRQITRRLGVSTMPAREAIRQLISERALTTQSQRAVMVPLMRRTEFEEITALRLHLEGWATETAAPHITAADLDLLRTLSQNMDHAFKRNDLDAYLGDNFRFHFLIYERSDLDVHRFLIELLWMRSGPLLRYCLSSEGARFTEGTHEAIIASLEAGEAASAADQLRGDISEAAKRISASRWRQDGEPATS
ncbi:GntR family transcriptional regulator [Acuticoccus sp. M5D2P5]|uniref:GntR family transcriptional regulator n=1 Tax=Acuticoccus kalidii TaxID=2910977 RepID=UPI001F3F5390|nr:GntR family transcriptional regulator [Acuticoccus kalidii]